MGAEFVDTLDLMVDVTLTDLEVAVFVPELFIDCFVLEVVEELVRAVG